MTGGHSNLPSCLGRVTGLTDQKNATDRRHVDLSQESDQDFFRYSFDKEETKELKKKNNLLCRCTAVCTNITRENTEVSRAGPCGSSSEWVKPAQLRASKDYLSGVCASEGVSHHHLHLAETQSRRTGRKLCSKTKAGLQGCSDWRLLARGSYSWAN